VVAPAFTAWRRAGSWLVASLAFFLVAACASAPQPRELGNYNALAPRLAVVDSERPPVNLTVGLGSPASIAVIYVAPGRSTRIVYPADSMSAPRLNAGTQRIVATWPRRRAPADSARRDSVARAARANTPRMMALPDPEAGLAPIGYLFLFATPSPLPYDDVRRKVEGVTTPLDTDEALNAIAKQVRSTLDPTARWAGYALEVVAQPDADRLPPRNERVPR
jgi:hypothetical protein